MTGAVRDLKEKVKTLTDEKDSLERKLEKDLALNGQKQEFLERENRQLSERANQYQQENSKLVEKLSVISNSQAHQQNDADQNLKIFDDQRKKDIDTLKGQYEQKLKEIIQLNKSGI